MKLKFREPHISGGEAVITISEETAIEFAKQCYVGFATDEDALNHFIQINDAWYDEDDYGVGACLDRPI